MESWLGGASAITSDMQARRRSGGQEACEAQSEEDFQRSAYGGKSEGSVTQGVALKNVHRTKEVI